VPCLAGLHVQPIPFCPGGLPMCSPCWCPFQYCAPFGCIQPRTCPSGALHLPSSQQFPPSYSTSTPSASPNSPSGPCPPHLHLHRLRGPFVQLGWLVGPDCTLLMPWDSIEILICIDAHSKPGDSEEVGGVTPGGI
jgi:hypothetical protein